VSGRSGATPISGEDATHRGGAEDTDVGDRGRSVQVEQRVVTKPARTSVAAVFALVFGVVAVFSVLTVILSPVRVWPVVVSSSAWWQCSWPAPSPSVWSPF